LIQKHWLFRHRFKLIDSFTSIIWLLFNLIFTLVLYFIYKWSHGTPRCELFASRLKWYVSEVAYNYPTRSSSFSVTTCVHDPERERPFACVWRLRESPTFARSFYLSNNRTAIAAACTKVSPLALCRRRIQRYMRKADAKDVWKRDHWYFFLTK